MADFVIPDFLQNCDVDTIHNKMMSMLPKDIDKTEGGFPWDFTRPTALIASELLEFYAVEILKLVFIQYSYGEYLDMLCEPLRIKRKDATYAEATLTVTGTNGTVIPAGTRFCTESMNDVPSVEFESKTAATISSGTASVSVVAVLSGIGSNVDANSIVLMTSPVSGVTSVTNASAATGGTDEEDDESLRERAMEMMRSTDISFVGNDADYKRWAESVDGVGTATVISEWDGPETVKIVCLDSTGAAASQTILDAVYAYIMSPTAPLERLAPPNTILTVAAPELVDITYTANVEAEEGYELEDLEDAFEEAMAAYYKTAAGEGKILYSRVSGILSDLEGVHDFNTLLINSGTANVTIDSDEYPATDSVTFTAIS